MTGIIINISNKMMEMLIYWVKMLKLSLSVFSGLLIMQHTG